MELLNEVPKLSRQKAGNMFNVIPTERRAFRVSVEGNDLLINSNTQDVFLIGDSDKDIEDYESDGKEDVLRVVKPSNNNFTDTPYLCMQPTPSCNLDCEYCFVKYYEDSSSFMDWKTAKKAVDYFVKTNPQKSDYSHVGFFGGEPTVAYDIVRDIVHYVSGKLSNQRKIQFHMTTNATMIDNKWMKLFDEFNWTFIVSLDGPKRLHNETRKDRHGNGTYDKVVEGLKNLSTVSNSITLRGTFLPSKEDTYLLERVKHLNCFIDEGYAQHASVEPVQMSEQGCLNLDLGMPDAFKGEEFEVLRKNYIETADWYLDELKKGNNPRFQHINKPMERVLWKNMSVSECFIGDTEISLLDGREVPIKDLVDEEEFWVYSSTSDGMIVPGRGHSCKKTRKNASLVKVTIDNGEEIKCTPDHPFMLRNGTYKEAKDLKEGESLMPLYRDVSDKETRSNVGTGYERFKDNNTGEWVFTHHRVSGFMDNSNEMDLDEFKDGYFKSVEINTEESVNEIYEKNVAMNHKVKSVEFIDEKQDVYDFVVDEYHNFALSSGVFVHNCGAGKGYFTVDWNGDIYACHRLNGTNIGNLDYGIDERLRSKWLNNHIYDRPDCMKCNYNFFCGGGCRQNSVWNMGDIRVSNPTHCNIVRSYLDACFYILKRSHDLGVYEQLKKVTPDPYRNIRVGNENSKSNSCPSCGTK